MSDILTLADTIVRGGLCDEARRRGVAALSDLFGGAGVMLFRQAGAVVEELEHAAWPDASVALCTGPLADPRANGMLEQLPLTPLGLPLRPEADAPEHSAASPVFRQGMEPFGLLHPLGALLARTKRDFSSVSIIKRRPSGPATRDDADLLSQLLPALTTADRMRGLLVDAMRERAMLIAALDAIDRPITIVDRNAKVRFANDAGQAALDRGDWLRVRSGIARPARDSAQPRFQAALERACEPRCGDAAVVDVSSERGGVTRVEPLRPGDHAEEPLALLLGTASARPSQRALREAYGLTPAEARLAVCLLHGMPLAEAAARLGRSVNTVKTEAKSLYAKVGATRQAEVVATVLPDLL